MVFIPRQVGIVCRGDFVLHCPFNIHPFYIVLMCPLSLPGVFLPRPSCTRHATTCAALLFLLLPTCRFRNLSPCVLLLLLLLLLSLRLPLPPSPPPKIR